MAQHLCSFLLPAKFHQRGNRIQCVEEKVRLQLHLKRSQLRRGKLPLQFKGIQCLLLGVDLISNDPDDSKYESIEQNFNAVAIQVKQVVGHERQVRGPAEWGEPKAP